MGNELPKEKAFGAGHPQRFYDGCTHVKDGEYATGEICFNQAMARHPGHAFWTSLMDVAIAKTGKPSGTAAATSAHRPLSPEALIPALACGGGLPTSVFCGDESAKAGESAVPDSKDAESPHPDANLSLNDPPSPLSESESAPTLLFPVDHRLVDLQDYVRMLTDIGRVYNRKAADSIADSREMSCRLGMLYNAYTAVRLQALLTVLRAHFAAHSTEEDGRGEDIFHLYTKRAMNAQWSNSAFQTEREHTDEILADGEVNMDYRSQRGGRDAEDQGYEVDLFIFVESMHYYFFINLLSYVLSSLRLLISPDCPMSPATQKGVLKMALGCFEVMEGVLAATAEANSHLYIGALMQKFIVLLGDCSQDCRPREETGTTFGPHRNTNGKTTQRTVKEREVRFLRFGSPDLCTQQLTFLRIAMRYPVMTLPFLNRMELLPVELEMHHCGKRRPVKLLTPLDRSYGWYMTVGMSRRFVQHAGRPGDSVFLLEKCGVPDGATMKDPTYFACVGLDEFSSVLFILAVAKGTVLKVMEKPERLQELTDATYQLSIDMCGGRTPVWEALNIMFKHLDDDSNLQ